VEDYVQARKLAESESLTAMATAYRKFFKPLTRPFRAVTGGGAREPSRRFHSICSCDDVMPPQTRSELPVASHACFLKGSPRRMTASLSNSLILDGYRLIRFLGRGGFGEVWLCRSESMGDYRALKFIPITHADRLEKEYDALLHYRKAASQLRSPHLVPIEHVNRNDAGLYYVMPLADGDAAADPSDPAWVPAGLMTRVHGRAEMPAWFSSREISSILLPILEGLQTLSDAGLVHRDVKPENILFFNGQPCLGDISLLGADASMITRRGTPGYATPSWYVGGHPDMYGAAATLYTLLTGNLPDRMGRAAFLWPPQGEKALSESERAEWKRLHGVIRRATDEKVSERFVDFKAMAAGVSSELSPDRVGGNRQLLAGMTLLLVVVVCVGGWWFCTNPSLRPEWLSAPIAIAPTDTPPGAKVADSPPSSEIRSRRHADGNLAYGALTATQGQLYHTNKLQNVDEEEFMSGDDNNLFQDTLVNVFNCVWSENELDFPAAIRFLDLCMNSIPRVRTRPNVRLARLLLQQCADGRPVSRAELDDPSFLVLGNDKLDYRVALLSHLNTDKAEEFLGNFITKESRTPREKSEAFVERARLRAKLGSFAKARTDADQSMTLIAGNSALKTQREIDILKIENEIPAYAEYVKSLPGK